MVFPRFIVSLVLVLLLTLPAGAADGLSRITDSWKGDLPELMEQKRPIRVLVSYNRTNFFLVDGTMRGMEHDLMKAYQKHLEKQYSSRHTRMVFLTVAFDELIPALLAGKGDIIAAGMTVTEARKQQVAFAEPYRTGIKEIVVGSPKAAPVKVLSDLAGKTFHVMAGSSYGAHLREKNALLKKWKLRPMEVVEADSALVTADLLEMTERGMVDYTVADSYMAEIWKSVLPDLVCHTDLPIHSGGQLAWAVRPGCPELAKSLSAFAGTVRQGTLMGNMIFKRYYKNEDWVKNPTAAKERQKLETLKAVFEKYGKEYDLDWIKLAAMAYQESGLSMKPKSGKGAVGIMQVKPATALDKNINVKNYDTLDGNVHAGTKYLRFLMDRYFSDVSPAVRVDFALAAYNAGPARVNQLRGKAKAMGLDPDRWFGNVEWAAYKEIGSETPTYVANVQMYYAAYTSIYKERVERRNDL